ncbi:MAG: GerMN domain-containing protein [Candidatus Sericytochromatia bacterium]|nr:GerMN domain-containing protein [Candidatus Sericytochromatia bacterium]
MPDPEPMPPATPKTWFLAAAIAASLAASGLAAAWLLRGTAGSPVPVTLYVADRQGMFLVPAPTTLALRGAPQQCGAQLFDALRSPPAEAGVSAIPSDARWVEGAYAGTQWRVTVSLAQAPGSTGERLLVGSLVRTLLGAVRGAREVRLALTDREGRPLPSQHLDLSTPLTLADVGNQLPSGQGGLVRTTLWWAGKDGGDLVPVQIALSGDAGLPPQDALERLVAGPGAEAGRFLGPVVPKGLQLRWGSLVNGVAHVDLGGPLPAGADAERLVKAVVLSLTEFPEVRAVQFLHGGQRAGVRLGNRDLATPLTRRDVAPEAP